MLGRLRWLLPAVIVAGIALAAPGGAFACGGGPSAVNVYTECVQNAGGSKPTGQQSGPTGQQSGPTAQQPLHVSSKTSKALAKVGGDKRLLAIVRNPGYGEPSLKSGGAAGSEPSALGSAFDLGSGPTALLLALAATALLLLGGSGLRVWRQRQRP